jgi:uncharacterized protein YigE (DUF2233 family)
MLRASVMLKPFLTLLLLLALHGCDRAPTPQADSRISSEMVEQGGQYFRVVRIDASRVADLRLFWRGDDDAPLGNPAALNRLLERRGESLVFATNAGIFDPSRSPLGLHIEDGQTLVGLNVNEGAGNFFLKPNGVFLVTAGRARICESAEFPSITGHVQLATQSGPLLLRGGQVHAAFDPVSINRKLRSGVGVGPSGSVVFVLSESRVTFHEFASLFRDRLDCPDALYLDGAISKMYAPRFGLSDSSGEFAGMLALVERAR